MKKQGSDTSSQRGFVLVYMAAALTCLLLFTGVAVDSGRAYVVKAQLTKAVDGAALAAARNLNSGNPRDEAAKIYRANFPVGYMGTTSSTDPAEAGFFTSVVDEASWRQHRHRDRHGDPADDLHEAREFRHGDREQQWRSDAANGGLVARARRVQLDWTRMGCGQRCGQNLHRCL